MFSDSGPTNQTNCAAWHNCVAHEAPKIYPSPTASHPVDLSENFDERIVRTISVLQAKLTNVYDRYTLRNLVFSHLKVTSWFPYLKLKDWSGVRRSAYLRGT